MRRSRSCSPCSSGLRLRTTLISSLGAPPGWHLALRRVGNPKAGGTPPPCFCKRLTRQGVRRWGSAKELRGKDLREWWAAVSEHRPVGRRRENGEWEVESKTHTQTRRDGAFDSSQDLSSGLPVPLTLPQRRARGDTWTRTCGSFFRLACREAQKLEGRNWKGRSAT